MSPKRKAQAQYEQAAQKAIELDDANVHPQAGMVGAIPNTPQEPQQLAQPQQQQPEPANNQLQTDQAYHGSVPGPGGNYDSYVPDPNLQQPPKPLTKQESKQELKRAIKGSESILAQASTVPLLTFFPDTISLDRAKLTVTDRYFFRMAKVSSLRVEDILSVNSTVGPFFGSVKVVGRVMNAEQTHEVGPLWRADAERIKRIIHGYVIALQRRIDVSKLSTSELASMLDQLGCDDRS